MCYLYQTPCRSTPPCSAVQCSARLLAVLCSAKCSAVQRSALFSYLYLGPKNTLYLVRTQQEWSLYNAGMRQATGTDTTAATGAAPHINTQGIPICAKRFHGHYRHYINTGYSHLCQAISQALQALQRATGTTEGPLLYAYE